MLDVDGSTARWPPHQTAFPSENQSPLSHASMLSRLVLLSLRHRGIVLALAVVLLGWGGYVASKASLDVFPEFVQPQVTLQTEAPGFSAEQVETLITRPVESAIN